MNWFDKKKLIHVICHILSPPFFFFFFQLGQQDLGNDFDMHIGPEMSVASIASPNPFNILAAGIGNSQPSFSLSHEQPNPP